MNPGLDYWHRFKAAFFDAWQREPMKLANAWRGPLATDLTSHYRNEVLRHIARALDLELTPEYLRIDYAMRRTTAHGCKVPVVFIESENAIVGADHEVEKLCAVSAPLRVLLTTGKWDEAPYIMPRGGYRTSCTLRWRKIIQAHHEVWPQTGILGVIVGEGRRKGDESYVKYHAFAFDMAGSVCDPDSPLFEQVMSWPAPPPWVEEDDA